MKRNYYDMWADLAAYLKEKTQYEVMIYPSRGNSERFHLLVTPLPNPQIDSTGQIYFSLLIQARSKSPSSVNAISNTTDCFIKMSELFQQPRGGVLSSGVKSMLYSQVLEQQASYSNLQRSENDFFIMGQWKICLQVNLSEIRSIYGSVNDAAS